MTAEGRFEICFKRVEVRTEMEGRGMMSRRKENLSKTEGKQKRNFKKELFRSSYDTAIICLVFAIV